MDRNIFSLSTRQFDKNNITKSLYKYSEDEETCNNIFSVDENSTGASVLFANKKIESKFQDFRDLIHLPKRSVVERREKAMDIIAEGVKRCRKEYGYKDDLKIFERLFKSRKYHDVTVAELSDLRKYIDNTTIPKPDGCGQAAFPTEVWDRIVKVAVVAMERFKAGELDGDKVETKTEVEPGRFKSLRRAWNNCTNIVSNISEVASEFVKKIGKEALAVVLFLVILWINAPLGLVFGALALVKLELIPLLKKKYFTRKDEGKQISQLSQELSKGWKADFAKKPDDKRSHSYYMMLVSNGDRFSMDLRSSLAAQGVQIDDNVLRGAILKSFNEMKPDNIEAEYENCDSDHTKKKIIFDGRTYKDKTFLFEDKDNGLMVWSFADDKAPHKKIFVREIRDSSVNKLEARAHNNMMMKEAPVLEKLKVVHDSYGNPLSNYRSMVPTKGECICQIFKDDSHRPTFSSVYQKLMQTDGLSKDDVKSHAKMITVLKKDTARLFSDLRRLDIQTDSINPDDLIIDKNGLVKLSLGWRTIGLALIGESADSSSDLDSASLSSGSLADSGYSSDGALETVSNASSLSDKVVSFLLEASVQSPNRIKLNSPESEVRARTNLVNLANKVGKKDVLKVVHDIDMIPLSEPLEADVKTLARIQQEKPKGFLGRMGQTAKKPFRHAKKAASKQFEAMKKSVTAQSSVLEEPPTRITYIRPVNAGDLQLNDAQPILS